jgi:hypothetical protein
MCSSSEYPCTARTVVVVEIMYTSWFAFHIHRPMIEPSRHQSRSLSLMVNVVEKAVSLPRPINMPKPVSAEMSNSTASVRSRKGTYIHLSLSLPFLLLMLVRLLEQHPFRLIMPHVFECGPRRIPNHIFANSVSMSALFLDVLLRLLQRLDELVVIEVVACDTPTPALEVLKNGAVVVVGIDECEGV